ncbi:MAG: DsbC family protein [Methylococcaceae bacterium]|jgi:thiol:disulfide interchange protein DsbC|nr:DsbC family protein [Methylococcaceae bacterium]OYV21039.1 MAG: thiol:disulfide interchange protein DsbC [Methylococcaceae bacterium NSM2-1]MDD1623419.1 DsbC family protein [Methylococcaceae bacterium]MDD1631714.1 DsbC family protein [Methylococcaceae bacterium]MDD1636679.1 DsbC family protein [Methylococcaceae bacterium]
MRKVIKIAALSLFGLMLSAANADEVAIKRSMAKSMPSVKIDSVKPSEVKGLYEVIVGANIFYVSGDGKYLLQGRLVDVATRKDLTEEKLSNTRKQAIEKVGQDNMIVFKPKIKKYTVSVFTDIDCGYCRKLHSEIDQYLAQGITIQYLFFPRTGKDSDSYNKAVSVWCADDRNAALTAAKKDQKVPAKTCDNPVDEHMQLGADFDVKGTPMIVSENGNIYPGYLPAKQLVEALESEKNPK